MNNDSETGTKKKEEKKGGGGISYKYTEFWLTKYNISNENSLLSIVLFICL